MFALGIQAYFQMKKPQASIVLQHCHLVDWRRNWHISQNTLFRKTSFTSYWYLAQLQLKCKAKAITFWSWLVILGSSVSILRAYMCMASSEKAENLVLWGHSNWTPKKWNCPIITLLSKDSFAFIILGSICRLGEQQKLTLFPWQMYFILSIVDLQWLYVLYQCIFPEHVKINILTFKNMIMKYIFTNRVNKTLPITYIFPLVSSLLTVTKLHQIKTTLLLHISKERKKEIKYIMYSTFATNFTLSRDNFCWHSESINYATELQEGEIQN